MDGIVPITGEEVEERLSAGEPLTIIDVRQPEEYRNGHIPGAVLIPMGEIPDRMDEIRRHGEVIFVCRSGRRSGLVCEYLQEQGFSNVKNLEGGMLAWNGDVVDGD
jgi:rhodanese-related sulfurtransferase